jgi:tRNA dimethylallyltransferase
LAKVIVIGGPTGSGKSALACEIAQTHKGVILNGDSLQVYRGLDILTDQPSRKVQQEIPHRLYGFLEPTQLSSAGLWLSHVVPEIEKSLHQGQQPIVVGGTGLYLKILLEGMSPIPSFGPEIRKDLQEQHLSQEALYEELKVVDAALAARLHPHDSQRTLRGLEVYYGTGKPLSYWQTQKPTPLPYTFETLLVMPSKEDLQVKIRSRIEAMLSKGVLEEVAAVLSGSPSATAMKAIGLREFGTYLEGKCSLEDAKEPTFVHTCQYAKRQRTWFGRQFKA